MGLSFQEDDFIKEKVHWIICLSDGSTVYQDDHRPGEQEPVAWIRLKEYLKDKDVCITSFKIKFFSHIVDAAPPEKEGYFFIQKVSALAFTEAERPSTYYVVGFLNGEDVVTVDWLVPEIIPISRGVRRVSSDDPSFIPKKSLV